MNYALQYAFCWVIVFTMLELSWTISVLANTMTLQKYRRFQIASSIFALTLSFAYTLVTMVLAYIEGESYVKQYEITASVAYFVQIFIYIISLLVSTLSLSES